MLCLALPPCCKVPKLDIQSEFSTSKISWIFQNPPVKIFITKWSYVWHLHFKETINESHFLVPDKRKGSVKSYDNNWATALQWFTVLCTLVSMCPISQWFKCYYSTQSKWAQHNSWLNSLPKVTLDNKFLIRNSS